MVEILVAGLAVYMAVLLIKQLVYKETPNTSGPPMVRELDTSVMIFITIGLGQLTVWWPFWDDAVWPLVDGFAVAAVATGYHTLRRLLYRLGSAL